ncbi:unnamed protein product [Ceratitis capitata]|uniref:(Mediterranean fruit fly) hypothetical protein n=1 Tax=Ceratitis capitata TaxID=7213 RepID=A0A811UUE8_CERCA|nr:unnamed protein product [Ceratitis capitata]
MTKCETAVKYGDVYDVHFRIYNKQRPQEDSSDSIELRLWDANHARVTYKCANTNECAPSGGGIHRGKSLRLTHKRVAAPFTPTHTSAANLCLHWRYVSATTADQHQQRRSSML